MFGEDYLPSNSCKFFLMLAVSVILAPVCYVAHVSNLLTVREKDKINGWLGIFIFLIGVSTTIGLTNEFGTHFHIAVPTDRFMIFLWMFPASLIGLTIDATFGGVCLAFVFAVLFVIYRCKHYYHYNHC